MRNNCFTSHDLLWQNVGNNLLIYYDVVVKSTRVLRRVHVTCAHVLHANLNSYLYIKIACLFFLHFLFKFLTFPLSHGVPRVAPRPLTLTQVLLFVERQLNDVHILSLVSFQISGFLDFYFSFFICLCRIKNYGTKWSRSSMNHFTLIVSVPK